MDLKDFISYLFVALGIAGVAWFAWVSRRGKTGRDVSMDDSSGK